MLRATPVTPTGHIRHHDLTTRQRLTYQDCPQTYDEMNADVNNSLATTRSYLDICVLSGMMSTAKSQGLLQMLRKGSLQMSRKGSLQMSRNESIHECPNDGTYRLS